jgi:cytidylate kinase
MPTLNRDDLLIEDFVQQQIEKWSQLNAEDDKQKRANISVVTLCMEPGSGGCLIAEQVAKRLDFDFFHRDIIHKIAESARISATLVESLEKDRLSGVQDFIASVVKDQYIHPSIYLDHLMKVVGTIGRHGRAVIVGRGANFIIPPKDRVAVRVVAPERVRIERVAKQFGASGDEAKRRVTVRENRRQAFIRQSFNADICDPVHYDLIVNTAHLSVEAGVESIIGAMTGAVPEK